jgi:hypothetical protein
LPFVGIEHRGLRARKGQHEGGARRVFNSELELSSLSAREAASDGEAETESRAAHRILSSVERSKHRSPLTAWDAGTVVGHLDS